MFNMPPILTPSIFPIIMPWTGDDKKMKKDSENKKLILEVGKRYKLKQCPGYNGSICFIVLDDKVDIWPSTMNWMFRKTKYRKNGLHSLENDFLIRLDAFVPCSKGLAPEEFKRVDTEFKEQTKKTKSVNRVVLAWVAGICFLALILIWAGCFLYYFFS